MHARLLQAFETARGDRPRSDPAEIGAELLRACEEAKAAWPGVTYSPEELARVLGGLVQSDDALAELRQVHAADVYLACACVAGDTAAVRAFGRVHLARVREWVNQVDRSEAFADDVRQEASRRLLVASDRPPDLAGYSGRGALGAYVRIFVTRLARKMKRGKAQSRHVEIPLALEAPDLDPEVALLRRRYAREFSDAFRATLTTLSADERNVLKLHYLDGLSIEEVGTTYRVSRATAARWLARARSRVVEETQRMLVDRLGMSAPNAASMLALVQSQLGASLMRFLKE
jgi:RNA polymerase sigma-70 factor, ECF subfamily